MCSRTAHTRSLTTKPAPVPFRLIVCHECKLGSKHPPFTREGQIATLHVVQVYVVFFELCAMFGEASTQCPPTFSGFLRCLTNVNQLVFEIERVNSASFWAYAFCEWEQWTALQASRQLVLLYLYLDRNRSGADRYLLPDSRAQAFCPRSYHGSIHQMCASRQRLSFSSARQDYCGQSWSRS